VHIVEFYSRILLFLFIFFYFSNYKFYFYLRFKLSMGSTSASNSRVVGQVQTITFDLPQAVNINLNYTAKISYKQRALNTHQAILVARFEILSFTSYNIVNGNFLISTTFFDVIRFLKEFFYAVIMRDRVLSAFHCMHLMKFQNRINDDEQVILQVENAKLQQLKNFMNEQGIIYMCYLIQ